MLCYAMLCYVMSYYYILRYCYVMFCYLGHSGAYVATRPMQQLSVVPKGNVVYQGSEPRRRAYNAAASVVRWR
jgi:hypothetical protein